MKIYTYNFQKIVKDSLGMWKDLARLGKGNNLSVESNHLHYYKK